LKAPFQRPKEMQHVTLKSYHCTHKYSPFPVA